MNLANFFNSIKILQSILLKLLRWTVAIGFLFSLLFTQGKFFALIVCIALIIWFFAEYVKIIQLSDHARKKYEPHDPKLWKLQEELDQRIVKTLSWGFLGGLGVVIIAIWRVLQ
jgi:hypothetical protein